MCRWALAALLVVATLAGARLLQGTAVGASLNARVYAVAHFFTQVTGLYDFLQSQPFLGGCPGIAWLGTSLNARQVPWWHPVVITVAGTWCSQRCAVVMLWRGCLQRGSLLPGQHAAWAGNMVR